VATRHHYAENTAVPVERTKQELDALLQRHGATQRGMAVDDERHEATCYFSLDGRQVLLRLPMPRRKDYGSQQRWEQAGRARWRQVLLITKAKLEHIALKLSTVEHEFLADIRLPNGSTVGQEIASGLHEMYATGRIPPLLGMGDR
jgi:hypothetical protein